MIVRGWNFDTSELRHIASPKRELWLLKRVANRPLHVAHGKVVASGRFIAAKNGLSRLAGVVAWATIEPDTTNIPDENGDLV